MSGRVRDYAHVLRIAAIFVGVTLIFLVVRGFLVPSDFGKYGFYRAGALNDVRAKRVVYAGHAVCADCHADIVESRRGSKHERIGCESCHGPLARHASGEDSVKPARPDLRVTCIRCHAARAGKPAGFPKVVVADHAPEGACTACHQPHHPEIS